MSEERAIPESFISGTLMPFGIVGDRELRQCLERLASQDVTLLSRQDSEAWFKEHVMWWNGPQFGDSICLLTGFCVEAMEAQKEIMLLRLRPRISEHMHLNPDIRPIKIAALAEFVRVGEYGDAGRLQYSFDFVDPQTPRLVDCNLEQPAAG